ncbi:MAG: hypothetical protein HUK15_03305, partial [Bacteroidales bacterium]|nr:hypothetical protein [Bacteroidales bacterium]
IYIPASIREDYLENHVHFIFGTLDGNGHSISIEDYTDEEISRLYHYIITQTPTDTPHIVLADTTLTVLDPKPILAKITYITACSSYSPHTTLCGGAIKNLNFVGSYKFPFCLSFGNVVAENPYWIDMCNVNNYANFNFPEGISVSKFAPLYSDISNHPASLANCNNYGDIIANGNSHLINCSCIGFGGNVIDNCNNFGNIANLYRGCGIAGYAYELHNCCNYGEIYGSGPGEFYVRRGIAGICDYMAYFNPRYITNCRNFGNIDAIKQGKASGIVSEAYTPYWNGLVAKTITTFIENCSNYGKISGSNNLAGIVGDMNYSGIIRNCYNSGEIDDVESSGTIVNIYKYDTKITNCLSTCSSPRMIGRLMVSGSYAWWEVLEDTAAIWQNNFYDKQMARGTFEDIPGSFEGKLTDSLVGFNMQDRLGDGWSYDIGRYPIQLPFAEDESSLLFAQPIFLNTCANGGYESVATVATNFRTPNFN